MVVTRAEPWEDDGVPSPGFIRFLRSVSTLMLFIALGGALMLMLRPKPTAASDELSIRVELPPGVVVLEPSVTVGLDPFTESVAVDVGVDNDVLALPPADVRTLVSPHGRNSAADRLLVDLSRDLALAHDRLGPGMVALRQTVTVAGAGIDALEDLDGDGYDDDGRVTVTASDGSAVCVEVAAVRSLAAAQGTAVDPEDGAMAHGVSWDPTGPCGQSARARGFGVRFGSTPGVFGATARGDVCDVARLEGALVANERVGAGFAFVHGLSLPELPGFLSTLTPVVLLSDTLVTDHGWRNGTIAPRQAVLERGTAVLVDTYGVPVTRCASGSPLRPPQPLPAVPSFVGATWSGFAGVATESVQPAVAAVDEFVLIDLTSGAPIVRRSGVDGALARLAGPVVGSQG